MLAEKFHGDKDTKKCEDREKTNKMQQSDIYSNETPT